MYICNYQLLIDLIIYFTQQLRKQLGVERSGQRRRAGVRGIDQGGLGIHTSQPEVRGMHTSRGQWGVGDSHKLVGGSGNTHKPGLGEFGDSHKLVGVSGNAHKPGLGGIGWGVHTSQPEVRGMHTSRGQGYRLGDSHKLAGGSGNAHKPGQGGLGDSHKLAEGSGNAHNPGLGGGVGVGGFTQTSRRFGECTQAGLYILQMTVYIQD